MGRAGGRASRSADRPVTSTFRSERVREPMRLTLALTVTLLAGPAAAQQAGDPAPPASKRAEAPARANDEAAIRGNDEAFARAFDAGDAAALAATFTDDAEVIDEDGQVVEGRDAITAYF